MSTMRLSLLCVAGLMLLSGSLMPRHVPANGSGTSLQILNIGAQALPDGTISYRACVASDSSPVNADLTIGPSSGAPGSIVLILSENGFACAAQPGTYLLTDTLTPPNTGSPVTYVFQEICARNADGVACLGANDKLGGLPIDFSCSVDVAVNASGQAISPTVLRPCTGGQGNLNGTTPLPATATPTGSPPSQACTQPTSEPTDTSTPTTPPGSATPMATNTTAPSSVPSDTPTSLPANTATPTFPPLPTATPTFPPPPTFTPRPTATRTPTSTPSPTNTPTPRPTATIIPLWSPTPRPFGPRPRIRPHDNATSAPDCTATPIATAGQAATDTATATTTAQPGTPSATISAPQLTMTAMAMWTGPQQPSPTPVLGNATLAAATATSSATATSNAVAPTSSPPATAPTKNERTQTKAGAGKPSKARATPLVVAINARVLRPGDTLQIAIRYQAGASVTATLRGATRRDVVARGKTNKHGIALLHLRIPVINLPSGHKTVSLAVLGVNSKGIRSTYSTPIQLANLIALATMQTLRACVQTLQVYIAYFPNLPVQLSVQSGRQSRRLTLRTGRSGTVIRRIPVSYLAVRAAALNVAVGINGRHKGHNDVERLTVRLAVPAACRG